jgi:predicted amidohydrolase YtcJ
LSPLDAESVESVHLIVNADIVTMSPSQPRAEAMAFDGNKIIAVGDEATVRAAAGASPELYDLGGATVVPGFIESHEHMIMHGGVTHGWADLTPATTRDRDHAIAKLRRQPLDDNGWILGFGVEPLLYENEKGQDTWRKTLDEAFPEVPVFLMHNSGHAAFANSRLFDIAGITVDTQAPPGGEFVIDENGDLEGFIKGRPAWMAIRGFPAYSAESTQQAAEMRAAVGITTATELAISTPHLLEFLGTVTDSPEFPVRVVGGMFISMQGLDEIAPSARQYETDLFKLRFIKSWADGSIQGGTGALSEGYYDLDVGDVSGLTDSADGFNAQVLRMYRLGYWPALHANGDAAMDLALDAIEFAQREIGNKNARPQLIHCQYVRREQFERMAKLGASCSFFASHIYYYGDLHVDVFLGPNRGPQISALRWAIDSGVKASMHDDAPVAAPNPLLNMWAAVNRTTRSGRLLDQSLRITPQEALAAYTSSAAWQIGMENELGTLETGKYADFVILDKNPLEVDAGEIKNIRIKATVLNGRITHASDQFYSGAPSL